MGWERICGVASESEFETLDFRCTAVDRCTGCKGLWFDLLEKEDMLRRPGAEKIDIGDPVEGARLNEMENGRCPRCNDVMIRMVDKDQFHIEFESCPSCYGTFFDAGEFSDLKEETVMERLTHLLQTLKSNL